MTAAFVLRQDVDFGAEVGVRRNRTRLCENLATLDFFTADAADQSTDVVASFTAIKQLAEHFDAGDGGLAGVLDADDFDFVANVHNAGLDTTGNNRTTTRDREHVFDRHQEVLVDRTVGLRDVAVDSVHQSLDRGLADFRVTIFQSGQSRTLDDGDFIAVEAVFAEQFANFQFNQLEQFFVVDLVDLVQVDNQSRNANLASKQDVLAGLRHRAVGCVHDQDCAVHLRSTGDHVLHVVGVARAVDVCIVTRVGFVFDVRGRDGDAALTLFGGLVDVCEIDSRTQDLGDRRGQRGLAVVDVADGADVDVRLVALKFFLRHFSTIPLLN